MDNKIIKLDIAQFLNTECPYEIMYVLLEADFAGKLLMSLVCEYFEWCELEHTLKVFLPELNQVVFFISLFKTLTPIHLLFNVSLSEFPLMSSLGFELGIGRITSYYCGFSDSE